MKFPENSEEEVNCEWEEWGRGPDHSVNKMKEALWRGKEMTERSNSLVPSWRGEEQLAHEAGAEM